MFCEHPCTVQYLQARYLSCSQMNETLILTATVKHMIVQRKLAAAAVIVGHFADGARDPVNVEGAVRQAVLDNATSAAVDLFDAAQKQVSWQRSWHCCVEFLVCY